VQWVSFSRIRPVVASQKYHFKVSVILAIKTCHGCANLFLGARGTAYTNREHCMGVLRGLC
jgi:hypothetical protein